MHLMLLVDCYNFLFLFLVRSGFQGQSNCADVELGSALLICEEFCIQSLFHQGLLLLGYWVGCMGKDVEYGSA